MSGQYFYNILVTEQKTGFKFITKEISGGGRVKNCRNYFVVFLCTEKSNEILKMHN